MEKYIECTATIIRTILEKYFNLSCKCKCKRKEISSEDPVIANESLIPENAPEDEPELIHKDEPELIHLDAVDSNNDLGIPNLAELKDSSRDVVFNLFLTDEELQAYESRKALCWEAKDPVKCKKELDMEYIKIIESRQTSKQCVPDVTKAVFKTAIQAMLYFIQEFAVHAGLEEIHCKIHVQDNSTWLRLPWKIECIRNKLKEKENKNENRNRRKAKFEGDREAKFEEDHEAKFEEDHEANLNSEIYENAEFTRAFDL